MNKFIILLLLVLFISCDSKRLFEEYSSIDRKGWHIDSIKTFDYYFLNQNSKMKFYIGLRNNNEFLYSNLYLFSKLTFPDGNYSLDTLNFILANKNGKWLGNGISEIKYNLFEFNNSVYEQHGNYNIQIGHGMRDSILVGIEDIGIRIEKN